MGLFGDTPEQILDTIHGIGENVRWAKIDPTDRQWLVLDHLASCEPATAGEIARNVLYPGTSAPRNAAALAGRMLKGLEKRGLVEPFAWDERSEEAWDGRWDATGLGIQVAEQWAKQFEAENADEL